MRLLGENILVEPIVEQKSSSGFVVLPENRDNEKTSIGIVKAVGIGELKADGSRTSIQVEVGDKVLWNTHMSDNANGLRIVNQRDILCVVKE